MENVLFDQRLEEAFDLLKISRVSRASLEIYGNLLKLKDESTYYHCLRVALYGIKIAELLHLDKKAMFYSGLVHDIGKILIDKDILAKKKDFNESDYRKIKKHPLHGYYLLRDVHNFSAEIILRHHRHTKRYPKKLPPSGVSYSPDTRALIEYYSKMLAIIDFYDSASTRKSGKSGKIATKEKVRSSLIQRFPTETETINLCYAEGIFGKAAEEIFGELIEKKEKNETVNGLVALQERSFSLAEKVGRNITLACVLEPIPDKPGCTTRYVDLKDTKTLEMFITAGVNIGPSFVHLVEYLKRHKSPEGSYQFLKEAMLSSKFLRAGGKINQGMLEFLIPVVITNVLHDPSCEGRPQDILSRTAEVLRSTTSLDLRDLIETKKIGNKMSGVETKYPVREHRASNVYDYYQAELDLERLNNRLNGVVHNLQFVGGFPDVNIALNTFLNSSERKFAKRVKESYERIFQKEGYDDLGVGLAADFIAVMLYLVFMFSKDEEIIN